MMSALKTKLVVFCVVVLIAVIGSTSVKAAGTCPGTDTELTLSIFDNSVIPDESVEPLFLADFANFCLKSSAPSDFKIVGVIPPIQSGDLYTITISSASFGIVELPPVFPGESPSTTYFSVKNGVIVPTFAPVVGTAAAVSICTNPPFPGTEWVCGPRTCATGDTTIADGNIIVKDSTPITQYYGRYCVTQQARSDQVVLTFYHPTDHNIEMCKAESGIGYTVPSSIHAAGFYCTGYDLNAAHNYCCPSQYPILLNMTLIHGCVANNAIADTTCQNAWTGSGSGVYAQESESIQGSISGGVGTITDHSQYFYDRETDSRGISTYICGGAKCVTNGSQIIPPNANPSYYGKNVDASIAGGLGCIANGTQEPGSGTCFKNPLLPTGTTDSCVCLNGMSFPKSLYGNVSGAAAAEILLECSNMPANQQTDCLVCTIKNFPSGATTTTNTSYRWSASLGCIDTRMNPFITRIIQIGLGVGSGIAVLRIIQGAFMRQTNDPAKIQEGNEIIISTVLALVVLAAALILLQIIGVNVLGLFTIEQYNVITGLAGGLNNFI